VFSKICLSNIIQLILGFGNIFTHFNVIPSRLVIFRTTGIGESNLQEKIGLFQHSHVRLSYRAMGREVQIKLRFSPECRSDKLDNCCTDMVKALGECIFAIEGWGDGPVGSLGEVVSTLLSDNNLKLVCAESASGGEFVRLMGLSSKDTPPITKGYFFAGQNDLKEMLCLERGTEENIDYRHLVAAMRSTCKVDVALIITPFERVKSESGDINAKTAQCFLASSSEQICISDHVTGSDAYCQHAISYTALNFLRQWLLKSVAIGL